MNNWRLLLLAIVAVVQPILSFTDRNLIDGRQQCCDRPSSTPLRDTRSSLHGTYRLGETTSALRRLSDRDEIRENRRYEVNQRSPVYNRRSTERPLIEDRERVARQDPLIARASRAEYRLERSENSLSRERLLDGNQREGTARYAQGLKSQDFTRRVIDRTSRNAVERRDDRVYTDSSRESSFRVDYRTERFGSERLAKISLGSKREMHFKSGERKISLNRDARHVVRTKVDDKAIIEVPDNMNIRQRVARERISVVRRESLTRPDTERYNVENDEFRHQQRNADQRRSLSENTRFVERIRDMRIRLNAREENRENQRTSYLRLSNEKFGDLREQNKENTDRRESERMQMARRMRESRVMNTRNERNINDRRIIRESRIVNTQNRREIDVRREVRNARDEIRENLEQKLSRERILMDQRDTRNFRNTLNERNVDARREIKYSDRESRNTEEERYNHNNKLTVERVQTYRRDNREFRVMNNFETRDGRRVYSKREMRSNNLMRVTREESRGNSGYRLSSEIERRGIRDNIDSGREIRYNERRLTEKRNEISRDRTRMDRREGQEFRKMFNIVIRQERSQSENRESPDYRLSRERSQMERRISHESRIVNNQHERDTDTRQEIRNTERRSRDTREQIRENPNRYSMTQERREVDRRNIRESRIIHPVATRNERSVESDTENRREVNNNDRLSSQIRDNRYTRGSRLESRSSDRTTAEERDNSMLDRSTRSADRRNLREFRDEARLSRSVEVERRTDVFRSPMERTNKIQNRERELIESRFRNVKTSGTHERTNSVMLEKMETEDIGVANWQYVLYTLQAAYLCALFVQMLRPNHTAKPHKMNLHWLPISSHYNPIKVD